MYQSALGAAYLVVVAACIGLSGTTAFLGFSEYFHGQWLIPTVITVIICTGLLACDLAVRDRQKQGRALWPPLVGLLVFMLASSPGHFHYFYQTAIGGQSTEDLERASRNTFDEAHKAVATKLLATTNTDETRAKVEQLLSDLVAQIRMGGNNGYGVEAAVYPPQIRALLPDLPTPHDEFPAHMPLEPALVWYDLYSTGVVTYLDRLDAADRFIAANNARRESIQPFLENLSTNSPDDAAARILALYDATLALERDTRQLLRTSNPQENWELAHDGIAVINPDRLAIRSIPDSVRAATQGRYPEAAVAAIAASVLIDVFPSIFALMLLGGGRGRETAPEPVGRTHRPAPEPKQPGEPKAPQKRGLKIINQRNVGS